MLLQNQSYISWSTAVKFNNIIKMSKGCDREVFQNDYLQLKGVFNAFMSESLNYDIFRPNLFSIFLYT